MSPKKWESHPVWTVWNFILIRVPENLKEVMDDLIDLFNIEISRKRWETCALLIFTALLTIKYQGQVKWNKIPIQNPQCIRNVARVNYFFVKK